MSETSKQGVAILAIEDDSSMIKQGLSTKDIATAFSLSPETISVHRKHIRKKLGLSSKADSLRSYLASLPE